MYFRRTFGRLVLALTAFEAGCLSDGRGFIPGDVAVFAFHAHRRMQLCGAVGVGRRAETEGSRL